jgi:hypothetical protein
VSFLGVIDERLFVTEPSRSTTQIKVFDWRTGASVAEFGTYGEGPQEFIDVRWIVPGPVGERSLWAFDYLRRRLARLERDAAGSYRVIDQVTLANPFAAANPIWGDSGILSNGYFPDHPLFLMDGRGRPTSWIVSDTAGPAPHDLPVWVRGRLNRNRLAFAPEGRRFALVYQSANRIDFFLTDGTRTASTSSHRSVTVAYDVVGRGSSAEVRWRAENQWAYVGAYGSTRHVVALFCGASCQTHNDYPRTLHVYRWDGTLAAEIGLDRPVKAIAGTADDSFLFGFVDDPEPAILRWPLGDYLAMPGMRGGGGVRRYCPVVGPDES